MGAGFLGLGNIGTEVARIGPEILARAELERVHKYRDSHHVALGGGLADERTVPPVERSERRHQAHTLAFGSAPAPKRCAIARVGR